MRMNVLVMENLFYERRFSKIYDLKGSTRNRLIQATGKVNEVLLDENLMESKSLVVSLTDSLVAQKHPLYLREHSKRVLRTALFNDSESLSHLQPTTSLRPGLPLARDILTVQRCSSPTSTSWTIRSSSGLIRRNES